jgi:hypothetical protein
LLNSIITRQEKSRGSFISSDFRCRKDPKQQNDNSPERIGGENHICADPHSGNTCNDWISDDCDDQENSRDNPKKV